MFLLKVIYKVYIYILKNYRGYGTDNNEEPFRRCFKRILEIRSLCRQGVPIVGLTATADANYQTLIKETLCFSKNVVIITSAVHKSNVRLSINKVNIYCSVNLSFCRLQKSQKVIILCIYNMFYYAVYSIYIIYIYI